MAWLKNQVCLSLGINEDAVFAEMMERDGGKHSLEIIRFLDRETPESNVALLFYALIKEEVYEIKLGKYTKRSLARRNTMLVDPGSDSGADDSGGEQNAPTNDARATEPSETQPTQAPEASQTEEPEAGAPNGETEAPQQENDQERDEQRPIVMQEV